MVISIKFIETQDDQWINRLLVENRIKISSSIDSSYINRLTALNFLYINGELDPTDSFYLSIPIFQKLYILSFYQLVEYIYHISNNIIGYEDVESEISQLVTSRISRIDLIFSIINYTSLVVTKNINLATIYISDPLIKSYKNALSNIIIDQLRYTNISYGYNLPHSILSIMKKFMDLYGDNNISIHDINQQWIHMTDRKTLTSKKFVKSIRDTLETTKSILTSELERIKLAHSSCCEMWVVMATVQGTYYGSVLVFHNPNNPIGPLSQHGLMIQEINKSLPVLILQHLYPNISYIFPKINTLLEPGIISIANKLALRYIYVNPLSNQAVILKKHYNYSLYDDTNEELTPPCEDLFGWYDWYRKEIPPPTNINPINTHMDLDYHTVTPKNSLIDTYINIYMDTSNLSYITYDVYLKDVALYPEIFKYVPDQFLSDEMCTTAVIHDSNMLPYVPSHLRTFNMCLAATIDNPEMFAYVPISLMSKEICIEAVKREPEMITYIPTEIITTLIASTAILSNPLIFKYIPKSLITPSMSLTIVANSPDVLEYIPDHIKTIDMCLIALRSDPELLAYVPMNLLTPEICLLALTNDPQMFDIPEHMLPTFMNFVSK